MTRSSRRGPWLPEEDEALMSLVRSGGPNNWVRISQQIQHRSPKQCRERYHQNLKPSLKHDPITAQEGELIEQMIADMGKRWAEIARRLGNRSDNAVKNWWNGSINRRKRNPAQLTSSFKQVGSRLQPISFPTSTNTGHQSHRPSYESHYSGQWSQNVPPGYRPTTLQIPSPSHTNPSLTDGETSSLLPEHRLMTPHSSAHSISARPGSSISESKSELPPLRPASYFTHPIPPPYEPPLLSPSFGNTLQVTSHPPVISSFSDHHPQFLLPHENVSPQDQQRTSSTGYSKESFNAHHRQLPVVQQADYHGHDYIRTHDQYNIKSRRRNQESSVRKDTRMHVSNLLD